MPPTCNICMDKIINSNTRCKTCRKCLCIECYDRVSKFTDVSSKVLSVYKCPFCNMEDTQKLDEISSDILIRFTETAVLNFVAQIKQIQSLNEENTSLKEEFDEVYLELKHYEIQERKDHRDALKYRQLKTKIQELKNKGRKTIKMEEIEKMT